VHTTDGKLRWSQWAEPLIKAPALKPAGSVNGIEAVNLLLHQAFSTSKTELFERMSAVNSESLFAMGFDVPFIESISHKLTPGHSALFIVMPSSHSELVTRLQAEAEAIVEKSFACDEKVLGAIWNSYAWQTIY
jgi:hypothetical protein